MKKTYIAPATSIVHVGFADDILELEFGNDSRQFGTEENSKSYDFEAGEEEDDGWNLPSEKNPWE